ncbi:hypothetical protein BASA61_007450 [Batrachochytrium salamandrivorans]|nr:hypothetical protein BASA61_007450 [Batrachochytrium salamandrivorans]
MEYCDEKWATLAKYVEKKGPLDIVTVRDIVREVVEAMIYLKQHGIVHNDIHGRIKLIDFGMSAILPGWEEGKSVPSKFLNPPSTVLEYKAEFNELHSMQTLGYLLYSIITGRDPYIETLSYEAMLRETLFPESDTYKSGLKESAISLMAALHIHLLILVVECEQVTGHRIQSGLVPAIQKSRLRLLGRALDPGVENVYTWLRGGVLNGEADLDQRWLDGTVEHESMGTRHDNRALGSTFIHNKHNYQQQPTTTTTHNHGKGKPAPSGAFTHRIREDGEVFSGEEGRETSSDTTPLASVAGSVRMRSTDSDRSVRATPKKARDASPPPQDDLWVV